MGFTQYIVAGIPSQGYHWQNWVQTQLRQFYLHYNLKS